MATPLEQAPRPRLGIRLGKQVMRALDRFLARHSKAPTTPFLPRSNFPWTAHLEAQAGAIRKELEQIIERPEDIPSFHQLSPDQARISKGDNWKTFALRVFGHRIEQNCRRCPNTDAALDALPGLQNAWFSILAPRYWIPPHRGPTKAVVRCHLGLLVPQQADQCWIRVGDERRHWRDGECLLFDDTYEHEVRNSTNEARVVLFLDIDRPLDRVGTLCRRLVLALVRSSAYVKRPLANLEHWNRQTRQRVSEPADTPAAASPSATPTASTADISAAAVPPTPARPAHSTAQPANKADRPYPQPALPTDGTAPSEASHPLAKQEG